MHSANSEGKGISVRQRSVNTGLQVLEDPPPPCIPPGIVLGIDFKLSIIGKHVIGPEEPRSCIVTYKDVHSVVSPGHQNGSHPSPGKDAGDPTEDPQPFGRIYSTKITALLQHCSESQQLA